jgi:hypothetical protein
MPNFEYLVAEKLEDARKRYPEPIHSLHESYALMKEELEEFFHDIIQRDQKEMVYDLLQVAAMAKRTYEDLKLDDPDQNVFRSKP